jgi:hypothetical protein
MKKPKSTKLKTLTRSQIERLALLGEALGQASEVVGRVLRMGYNLHSGPLPVRECGSIFPIGRVSLQDALGNIVHAVDRMTFSGDVACDAIQQQADWKAKHVEASMLHQGKAGFKTAFLQDEKQRKKAA